MVVESKFSRSEKYDPTVGYWTPETKPTRLLELSSNGSTTPATEGADFVLDSGTIATGREGFITAVGFGASANTVFCVTKGTSTILSVYVPANDSKIITGSADSPLGKISAGETVRIIALSASTAETYSGFLVAKIDPIASKLVTES